MALKVKYSYLLRYFIECRRGDKYRLQVDRSITKEGFLMAVVSISNLLEAGVHFGHQTKRWNPKMKEYIFTTRDDIYIIDLQKTLACMEEAYTKISDIAKNGGTFLFVGTKKQAQEASIECANRSKSLEEELRD